LLYSEVIEHVRAITAGLSISQRELAARLGVSEARVSRIMSGRENLTLRTLADLGWALGVRFEAVAVALADRTGTPAAADPAAPAWLRRHAQPDGPLRADRALDPGTHRSCVSSDSSSLFAIRTPGGNPRRIDDAHATLARPGWLTKSGVAAATFR
jgi:transcriptional regulator with XRE-family HTH domain